MFLRLTVLGLLLAGGGAWAQSTIDYHPNGVVRLGFGYEPLTPTIPFVAGCISHEGVENIDSSGVAMGSVEVSEVRDRLQLMNTVGVSATMEAHNVMFSGGASFSQSVGVTFEESSLVWVARIKMNFGRFRLKSPTATALLLGATTPDMAKARCGSEIVTQESRGSVAAVSYEVNNLTSSEKQELATALNAKYSGPDAGARFDSAYRRIAEKVQSRSSIKTHIHVRGGPGAQQLAEFVTATDIAAVRAALAKYAKETTAANAAPLTYQTSPLSQFANLTFGAPPNLAQDRLWDIYSQYENLTGLIRRIDALVKPTSEDERYLVAYVDADKRAELGKVRTAYDQSRNVLKAAAVACLTSADATSCGVPAAIGQLPRVSWPAIPPAPTLIGARKCTSSLLRHVNSPPPEAGAKIGYANFRLGLTGESSLFKSVWLVAPDSRIPLEPTLVFRARPGLPPHLEQIVKAVEKQSNDTLRDALFQDAFPQAPLTDCTTRNVDTAQLFGAVHVFVDLRKSTPMGTLEVFDQLGRRTSYDLDKFE